MKVAFFIAALLIGSAAGAAKPVKIVRNSADLEFTYEWPAEAAAIPALDRRFRAEAANEYRRHLKLGRVDKQSYRQEQRGSATDFYSKTWSTAGETPRLLSLRYEHGTYTGGAHPNTDYGTLIWDRKLGRETSMAALFRHRGSFQELTRSAYCAALSKERAKRRGSDASQPGLAEFNACPAYSDLAISPADKNRDGRFETIEFVASPYTAGPYSEGEYAIPVPVTAALLAAMKPQYRRSFEAQRQ